MHDDTDGHFIAFGDRLLVLPRQIKEGTTEDRDDLFVVLQAVLQTRWVGVIDKIDGNEFVCCLGSCSLISLVQILIKQAANEGFVLFY